MHERGLRYADRGRAGEGSKLTQQRHAREDGLYQVEVESGLSDGKMWEGLKKVYGWDAAALQQESRGKTARQVKFLMAASCHAMITGGHMQLHDAAIEGVYFWRFVVACDTYTSSDTH